VRIKELADLIGITVRTVRHYHQIGLLPVPQTRFGVRDYDMVHVARLVRIRWLVRAGVALSAVADMLGAETSQRPEPGRTAVLADLRATVDGIDQRMAELRNQRDRLRRLIASIEVDGGLTPMPAAVARFYDGLEARTDDEQVRRVIRRERDFMELAFYRGDMPPELAVLYEGLNAGGLTRSLALLGELAERNGTESVEQIAAAAAERVTRDLGDDAPRVLASIDPVVARRAADLYLRLGDPGQRHLDQAIAAALLAVIEKGQPQ
jgi:DNA-binding transcriptional MerR regulator